MLTKVPLSPALTYSYPPLTAICQCNSAIITPLVLEGIQRPRFVWEGR